MEWTDEDVRRVSNMIQTSVNIAIPIAIKETVNGKIDRMDKKLDTHNLTHENDMKALLPYMQFASGLGIIGRVIVWIGSIAIAWLAIKQVLLGHVEVNF